MSSRTGGVATQWDGAEVPPCSSFWGQRLARRRRCLRCRFRKAGLRGLSLVRLKGSRGLPDGWQRDGFVQRAEWSCELRGEEAYTFLRAVNTGHPGSMTTVHADSAERAVEQIALLVLQTGTRLGRADVQHYVRSTVDVFVQLTRIGGRRQVSEIVLR